MFPKNKNNKKNKHSKRNDPPTPTAVSTPTHPALRRVGSNPSLAGGGATTQQPPQHSSTAGATRTKHHSSGSRVGMPRSASSSSVVDLSALLRLCSSMGDRQEANEARDRRKKKRRGKKADGSAGASSSTEEESDGDEDDIHEEVFLQIEEHSDDFDRSSSSSRTRRSSDCDDVDHLSACLESLIEGELNDEIRSNGSRRSRASSRKAGGGGGGGGAPHPKPSAPSVASSGANSTRRRRERLIAVFGQDTSEEGSSNSDGEDSGGGENEFTALAFCFAMPFATATARRETGPSPKQPKAKSKRTGQSNPSSPKLRPMAGPTGAFAPLLPPPLNSHHLKRQLTVVLDLDETLVNARHGPIVIRPSVDAVIEACTLVGAEIIVWTAGIPAYVGGILRGIKAALEQSSRGTSIRGGKGDHRQWYDHLITRNSEWYSESGTNVKDLRFLAPRKLENIIVVENNPLSLLHQPHNGVLVEDFVSTAEDGEEEKESMSHQQHQHHRHCHGNTSMNDTSLDTVAQIIVDVAERLGALPDTAMERLEGTDAEDAVAEKQREEAREKGQEESVAAILPQHPSLMSLPFHIRPEQAPDHRTHNVSCLALKYQLPQTARQHDRMYAGELYSEMRAKQGSSARRGKSHSAQHTPEPLLQDETTDGGGGGSEQSSGRRSRRYSNQRASDAKRLRNASHGMKVKSRHQRHRCHTTNEGGTSMQQSTSPQHHAHRKRKSHKIVRGKKGNRTPEERGGGKGNGGSGSNNGPAPASEE